MGLAAIVAPLHEREFLSGRKELLQEIAEGTENGKADFFCWAMQKIASH